MDAKKKKKSSKKKSKKKKKKNNQPISDPRDVCATNIRVKENDCKKRMLLPNCDLIWVPGPGSVKFCKPTKRKECVGKPAKRFDDFGCREKNQCSDYQSAELCLRARDAGANCDTKTSKKGVFKKCIKSAATNIAPKLSDTLTVRNVFSVVENSSYHLSSEFFQSAKALLSERFSNSSVVLQSIDYIDDIPTNLRLLSTTNSTTCHYRWIRFKF